jgi:hypothetical protein
LSPLHMDMGRQVSLVGFESLGEMVGSNQAMGLPLQWGALSRPDEGSVFLTMTGVVPSETSTDGGTIG